MFYVCESHAPFRSVMVRNKHSALLEDEGHILVFIQLGVISSLSVWSCSDIHYSSRRFAISQMAARGSPLRPGSLSIHRSLTYLCNTTLPGFKYKFLSSCLLYLEDVVIYKKKKNQTAG